MARIGVKLDDVESGFVVVPDDQYLVVIQESSKVVAKTANAGPYIRWIGKIKEPEDFEGKFISWNTSLLPQSLWVLKGMLEAIGAEWDEDGFDTEDCFGAELILTVATRMYEKPGAQPEPRNEVKAFAAVKKPAAAAVAKK